MSDVSNSQYLVFRGNTWHYQRRVPKHLVAVYGKAFVKQSLGVSDKKSAIKLGSGPINHLEAAQAA